MKRLPLALLLVVSAFSVQAQTSQTTVAEPSSTDEAVAIAVDEKVEVHYTEIKTAEDNGRCIRDTGSRIKRTDPTACNGEPGRSYSREELESAGGMDMADALRRLDPSISIGR